MVVLVAERPVIVSRFLETWARSLRGVLRAVHIDDLGRTGEVRKATHVFVDLERMSPARRAWAGIVADEIAAAGLPVLNRPSRVKDRYELLTDLHARGSNRAGVRRLTEDPEGLRFPVFIRGARDHAGAATPLLGTAGQLAVAQRALVEQGVDPAGMLVVEFVDASDDAGRFRKYASFRLGDRVLRGHLLFADTWHVKAGQGGPLPAAELAEKEAFVDGEAGELDARVLELFEHAGIDYGRVDFGIVDGEIQVWEINTNPVLAGMPESIIEPVLGLESRQAARLRAAFLALDERSPQKGWVPVDLPAPPEPGAARKAADSFDDTRELRQRLAEAERQRDRALKQLARARRSRLAAFRAR